MFVHWLVEINNNNNRCTVHALEQVKASALIWICPTYLTLFDVCLRYCAIKQPDRQYRNLPRHSTRMNNNRMPKIVLVVWIMDEMDEDDLGDLRRDC